MGVCSRYHYQSLVPRRAYWNAYLLWHVVIPQLKNSDHPTSSVICYVIWSLKQEMMGWQEAQNPVTMSWPHHQYHFDECQKQWFASGVYCGRFTHLFSPQIPFKLPASSVTLTIAPSDAEAPVVRCMLSTMLLWYSTGTPDHHKIYFLSFRRRSL